MPVYVAGGGGTHLEPRVTSHYLAALIAEGGARGVLGTVTAVKTQQSEIDAPLDDLVVDGRLPNGTSTRLDLQVTTTLSFTESDDKWADIVPRAWSTFRRTGFNVDTDRIGVAVSFARKTCDLSVEKEPASSPESTSRNMMGVSFQCAKILTDVIAAGLEKANGFDSWRPSAGEIEGGLVIASRPLAATSRSHLAPALLSLMDPSRLMDSCSPTSSIPAPGPPASSLSRE